MRCVYVILQWNKIYSYMQQYGWAERQWWAKYSGYKRIHAIWFHLGKVKRTAKIKQCNIYIRGTTMKSDSRQWATFIGEGEDVIGRGAHRKLLRFWQYFLSISCVFCLDVCILKMNILWKICMFYFHQYIFYNQNTIRKWNRKTLTNASCIESTLHFLFIIVLLVINIKMFPSKYSCSCISQIFHVVLLSSLKSF